MENISVRTSPAINDLAKALCAAHGELTNIAFDSVNPGFRSKFASLPAVRDGVVPVLAKHGIAVIQVPFGAAGSVGIVTRFMHTSGQWMEGELAMNVSKPGPQELGSILTYLRRYTLSCMAGVASEEDLDGEDAHNGRPQKPANDAKPAPAPKAEEKYIDAVAIKAMKDQISKEAGGATTGAWKEWLSKVCGEPITNLSQIPDRLLPKIVAALPKKEAA